MDERGRETLENLVERARAGDRAALESLVAAIHGRVYNLAIRMLWHPADAEDATQEILIRIVTNLATFRGDSAFTTWVYRVAANYLLTARKRRAEREEMTFARFAEDIDAGLAATIQPPQMEIDEHLLEEEVKIGCTHGMLLCLDRDHRMAYILGEVFELTGEDAAQILDITPVAFRKRLSRARRRLQHFMQRTCGIVNPDNPCRCARRIGYAIQIGRVDPSQLLFATHSTAVSVDEAVNEMKGLHDAAALFRSHPTYTAPGRTLEAIRQVISGSTTALLSP
jgi:RNA polymerase sigma factor (sigma-70 family)